MKIEEIEKLVEEESSAQKYENGLEPEKHADDRLEMKIGSRK